MAHCTPSLMIPPSFSTSPLLTCTPIRPSTGPSTGLLPISSSDEIYHCDDPINVSFGSLADLHSPTVDQETNSQIRTKIRPTLAMLDRGIASCTISKPQHRATFMHHPAKVTQMISIMEHGWISVTIGSRQIHQTRHHRGLNQSWQNSWWDRSNKSLDQTDDYDSWWRRDAL